MKIELGVSARHVHVSQEDLETLFGPGYELTKFKDLKQTGQYAANEKVQVEGPRGSFQAVRILGPVRKASQVEVSATDCLKLGVAAVLRDSGKLQETPGVTLTGPAGQVVLSQGVIVAARHVHLCPETAQREGIEDGDYLCAHIPGDREITFGKVLARVDASYVDEFHLDTDEANAAMVSSCAMVELSKCQK